MKIKVSTIDTNPYRHIDKYPINREKVEALKTSINQTGFWDNILLRPNGDRFQLAYGHHRLTAIKELGLDIIDVPVRDLDDATMLRIMANENMDEWRASPAVINETVYAAKEFIDAELAKYETWEDIRSNENIRSILGIDSGQSFAKLKGAGAGQTTILAFLGGNWKQWMIQEALSTIKDDEEKTVDRKATEVLTSVHSAKAFKSAVKEYDIPYEEQKEIAEKIVADERDSKREVRQAVQDIVVERNLKSLTPEYKPRPRLLLDEHLENAIKHMIQVNSVIDSFFENPDQVSSERMKFFVSLIAKAGESVTKGIGGSHGND